MSQRPLTSRTVAVLAALFMTLPGPGASRAFAERFAPAAARTPAASVRVAPRFGSINRLDVALKPVTIGSDGARFVLPNGLAAAPQALRFNAPDSAALAADASPDGGKDGALPRTAAGLQNLAVSGAEASASGSGAAAAKAGQDKAYEQGAAGSAAAADAVPAGDYMVQPPSLPLARLRPSWQNARKASAPDLGYRFAAGTVVELGRDAELGVEQPLKFTADAGVVRDLTPDAAGLSYGKRRFLELPGGVKQAALVGELLSWVDDQGRLVLYSPADGKKAAVSSPTGPIESYAIADDGRHAFVVAGGALQRWDLAEKKAVVLMDDKVKDLSARGFTPVRPEGSESDTMQVYTDRGTLFWTASTGKLSLYEGASEELTAGDRAAPPVKSVADGYWTESLSEGTRVWARGAQNGGGYAVRDLGTVGHNILALAEAQSGKLLLGVTDTGFLQWDLAKDTFRHFEVEGLKEAVVGRKTAIDVSKDGSRLLIQAGDKLFSVDLGQSSREAESHEASVRLWSEENPMSVKDGVLSIGEFKFAVQTRKGAKLPWYKAFWNWLAGLFRGGKKAPTPSMSYEDWQAVNLPSNKWAIYQTLKGFTLGHNVLYVGETGGGKTWMADAISKLIGRKLYMVSFTEYTKNQELIARTSFGEEGNNRTGRTYETVLKWLDDPEGGILLLDEIHKPLEGIAALNNILQNLKYHINGKDVAGSRKTHYVVATMNPAKQPYKGEPPSGELASRFGLTLEVNYLPPAEEAALLAIFHRGFPQSVARVLVDVATALRRAYVEGTLPLPISSRTLLNAAKHMLGFPKDDAEEIFRNTYNAEVVAPDEAVKEAVIKVLQAHGLSKAWAEARRLKKA